MKFQKGSDGYAQARNVRTFCIVFTLVALALYAVVVVPSHNFLHAHFLRASTVWKVVGFVSIAVQLWFTWGVISKILNEEVNAGKWINVVTVGWTVFNFCALNGFNFSIG